MTFPSLLSRGALMVACVLFAPLFAWAPARAADELVNRTNRGVVELEASNPSGASLGMATDLADLIDDGSTRRVVTVVGRGSLQNIVDLRALRGIDLAIIQADVLDYARQQKLQPSVDTVTYVAKLHNEEFHLLANRDVKTINDLAGKKVNFDIQGSGTGITAARIFAVLGITVDPTSDPTSLALAKLEKGDISAVAYVTGKPASVFRDIDSADGLHFLSIPLKPALADAYAPTRLTDKDYPRLVTSDAPVDTVAVGVVLAAANLQLGSERYKSLTNFVNTFFTQFPTLLEPGHQPKWHEVNLAAELPGWKRFQPAQDWLDQNAPVAAAKAPAPQDVRVMFQRFLDERLKASGSGMTQQQKDDLFAQFQRWQTGNSQ